ncbi:hypothetical protein LCGC14_2247960 [marine sediment metagenome]|uniref:Uncharacterized protein n=1 Tax=marine sediment metagenome TaxID=412755 RepID=A0A0F9D365_9ZZZZ
MAVDIASLAVHVSNVRPGVMLVNRPWPSAAPVTMPPADDIHALVALAEDALAAGRWGIRRWDSGEQAPRWPPHSLAAMRRRGHNQ